LRRGPRAPLFMDRGNQLRAQFEALYPFRLDPFQQEAIAHLAEGRSVLVAAPTGTGKTVVAEFGVYRAWKQGRRSIYTTPLKALSNQKFRDLRSVYGDVGLMTGDIVENPTGRIVVMTTEVLRNILVQTPQELSEVSVVVFDEIHYLSDPERGTVWEECILLLPKDVQIVALSATVSNAQEIARWMEAVHGPTHLVFHAERAVPLEHRYMYDGNVVTFMDASGRLVADLGDIGGELRQRRGERKGRPRQEPSPPEIVQYLRRANLLPAIYFLFRRKDTEVAAEACEPFALAKGPARRRIEERIGELLHQLSPEDRELRQVRLLLRLLRRGIAFHHAGLLPVLKVLVEELFNQGYIGVVFATDTLALGINMPARTVVIGSFTKFDGEVTRLLTPNEYQQMTGRAGRRGMDERGVALIPYSPWVSFKEVLQVVRGELLPVRSSFTIRYNSLVNLWTQDLAQLANIFGKSLASFQLDDEIRTLTERAEALKALQAELSKGCLIGLPGKPLETYEAHRKVIRQLEKELSRAEARLRQIRSNAELPAWPVPPKDALRAAVRRFTGGEVVHLRGLGWAAFRGRPTEGVAIFETTSGPVTIDRYDLIDYLQDPPPVVPDDVPLQEALQSLNLPDLEAMQAEFREGYQPEIQRLETMVASLEERLLARQTELAASPCHRCELLRLHRQQLRRAEFVELEIRQTEAELEDAQDRRRHEVKSTLDRMVRVLHALGYMEGGRLTQKAAMLANIFHPNGLVIVELIWGRHLDKLAPAEIAEVASWFAYDRDLVFSNRITLPSPLWQLRSRVAEIENYIVRTEAKNRLRLTPGLQGNFLGLAYAWASGATFDDLLSKVGISEGDVISTFNKALDLLNQIQDMLRKVAPDHVLTYTVPQAIALMRRGIVEQCYLLATPAGDQLSGAIELP
jgi:ATP-dependent RNA helicase HelY